MSYDGPSKPGRPRVSSRHELAGVALRLFRADGYHATTVSRIASEAGIGRSTFFNYFPTKEELIWSCTAHQLSYLERCLADRSLADDPFEVVARALIDGTASVGPEESRTTADYRAVIEQSPELQAVARSWSAQRTTMVTEFIARRLGVATHDVIPMSYALALNGAVNAAAIAFARSNGSPLSQFMREAVSPVYRGFATRVN